MSCIIWPRSAGEENIITHALHDKIRSVSDCQWLRILIRSIANPLVNGIEFPGCPSEELQKEFVGSANKKTLREVFVFYTLVKESAAKARNPLRRESRFLDFGCGWERFLRFFWKDVDEGNLFGCDVSQSIVDTCHILKMPGQIDQIIPRGSLPYPDSNFRHDHGVFCLHTPARNDPSALDAGTCQGRLARMRVLPDGRTAPLHQLHS